MTGGTEAARALRRLAEETLRQTVAKEPKDQAPMSTEEIQLALHELRVHQIELEMQNEELRRTQVELNAAQAEYFNLYDLAPVGYCTISEELLLKANLTAAGLLGVTRKALAGEKMSSFIVKEDQDIYYRHYKQLVKTGAPQVFELRMEKSDGTIFWVHLVATAVQNADGLSLCRMALSDISKLKGAEGQLRESEQNFKNLVNSGMALIWTSGTDKLCNFFNSVWLEFTGRTLEDEIGNGWVEGVHPDDLQRCLDIYVGAFERQEPFSMEYRLRRHDGTYRWIVDEGCPRYDTQGEFLGYIGHCLDIHERKRAEDAQRKTEEDLRESVAKFKVLFGATSDSVILFDVDGKIIDLNEITAGRRNLEIDAILGKNLFDFLPPEVAAKRQKAVVQVVEEKRTVQYQEARDERHYYLRLFPVFNDLGEVSQVASFSSDITEQRQAEESLRESEEKFRTVADHVYDWEYWLAADGSLVYVSPSCERITGYKIEEFQQDPGFLNRIIHPDDCEHFKRHLDDVVKGVANIVCQIQDFRILTRNGEERWIAHICQEVFGRDGKSIGRRASNRDITERKKAREEKLKLETQLQQAQKMEAIGQLAGGVAHDFNNMLGVIIGQAELALDEVAPDQPLFNNLEEIRKAARRSADITRQLLAFARKQIIAPRVLDLNETVEGMLKLLRRLIGEDIDLAWLPRAGLWPVKMDPSQIDQILANLCVNARDAIGGVGKMTIETGNSTLDEAYCSSHAGFIPGEYVRIAVSDNGSGMDKETLAHIFEPFFTTKGVGQGTGLGLATVYGAVKQNNGFINAYSEPGRGTTFTIYLPRYQGDAEQTRQEGAAEHAARGDETILLVEDELTTLEMATTMLQRLGYTVLAASTPGEAFRLAIELAGTIHLLVTDVIMPKMNGRDLAEWLKERRPGMKCLFMSGYTSDVIAQHGALDEGVCFIQKPFSKTDLAAKVREALESKKGIVF